MTQISRELHAYFDEVSCVDDKVGEELGVGTDQLARHTRLRRTHDAVATQFVRLDRQMLLDVFTRLSKFKTELTIIKFKQVFLDRCHFIRTGMPICSH